MSVLNNEKVSLDTMTSLLVDFFSYILFVSMVVTAPGCKANGEAQGNSENRFFFSFFGCKENRFLSIQLSEVNLYCCDIEERALLVSY